MLFQLSYNAITRLSISFEAAGIAVITSVFLIILFIYRKIKDSGVTTSEGRNRNQYDSKIAVIEKKINELKNLNKRKVIDDSELEIQLNTFEQEKKTITIDYYLSINQKYKSVLEAFKKGYINSSQKDEKITEIREQILKNVSKRK